MGILFGKRSFPLPAVPPFPGGPGDNYESYGTSERALTVPTVWACVSLVANTISMLPIEVFKQPNENSVARKVPTPEIFKKPEPYSTQSEWLHMVMVSLLLRGNAYGRLTFDRNGNPTSVVLLHPDCVQVKVDKNGIVTYDIRYKRDGYTNGMENLPASEIWHVRGLTLPGSVEGLSPIAYAAMVLGVDLSSRKFAKDFFDGSSLPKATVSSDQQIDQQQAQTIKNRIVAAMSTRDPIVLGAGLKFTPLQVNPEESQFLETQQADVAQIARYFGVPPEMVGGSGGSSMTYANVEQRSIDFLTFTIAPWIKRLEDAMLQLVNRTRIVQFGLDPLLRTDAKTTAEVDNMRIAGKIKTPTEIRAEINLPPMTEDQKDEVNLVPITVTPLGGMKGLPPMADPGGEPADVPDTAQDGSKI